MKYREIGILGLADTSFGGGRHFAISDKIGEKHFAISDKIGEKHFAISDKVSVFAFNRDGTNFGYCENPIGNGGYNVKNRPV